MAAKKTSFHQSSKALPDFEVVTPAEPEHAGDASGDCCICDNPATSLCHSEAPIGLHLTLSGAQVIAYWLGR